MILSNGIGNLATGVRQPFQWGIYRAAHCTVSRAVPLISFDDAPTSNSNSPENARKRVFISRKMKSVTYVIFLKKQEK
jgi:hypothetical protein